MAADPTVGIGEEWERQTFAATEGEMAFAVVGADPGHGRPAALKGAKIPLEAAGLQRAAAGEIAGVKIKNQPLAPEIGQGELATLLNA